MATGNSGDESSDRESDNEQQDKTPPSIPFDSSKMDLIIDFRAACSLPYDPDTDGVKALRAIIFGKGKAVHVPNESGKIFVCGEWRLVTSLMKVHYVASTHREPELLISFVDYGFASSTMSGVSVETLALPLLIKKNVYQDALRLTRIDDVAGFSPIPHASAPWSITLKPTLAKQEIFKKFNIYALANINTWLSSQKMADRVKSLAKMSRSSMTETLKEVARQDPTQANKTKAVFEAKLASILAAIGKLPPSAYDVRLSTRIIQLLPGRDAESDPVCGLAMGRVM